MTRTGPPPGRACSFYSGKNATVLPVVEVRRTGAGKNDRSFRIERTGPPRWRPGPCLSDPASGSCTPLSQAPRRNKTNRFENPAFWFVYKTRRVGSSSAFCGLPIVHHRVSIPARRPARPAPRAWRFRAALPGGFAATHGVSERHPVRLSRRRSTVRPRATDPWGYPRRPGPSDPDRRSRPG